MPAAIDMDQLAATGSWLAPQEVASAGALLLHQPGELQRAPHHGVGPPAATMVPLHHGVEVPDVVAAIARLVELRPAADLALRDPVRCPIDATPILEPLQPVRAVALAPPPQGAGTDAEHLGRLPPRHLPARRVQDDLLKTHGPLQGGCGRCHRWSLLQEPVITAPPARRSLRCSNAVKRVPSYIATPRDWRSSTSRGSLRAGPCPCSDHRQETPRASPPAPGTLSF